MKASRQRSEHGEQIGQALDFVDDDQSLQASEDQFRGRKGRSVLGPLEVEDMHLPEGLLLLEEQLRQRGLAGLARAKRHDNRGFFQGAGKPRLEFWSVEQSLIAHIRILSANLVG